MRVGFASQCRVVEPEKVDALCLLVKVSVAEKIDPLCLLWKGSGRQLTNLTL